MRTAPVVVAAYFLDWKVERIFWLAKLGFRLEDWHQESAQRVDRRLLLVQLAPTAVYQLLNQTDPASVELIQRFWAAGQAVQRHLSARRCLCEA